MKIFATLLVVATLLAGCNVSFNSDAEKAGEVEAGTADQQMVVAKAASAFLKQLDAGAVEQTWDTASPYLHQLSNQTVWSVGIRTFRGSVGAVKSRKLKGVGFTHTVEGVPTGDYAAVGFDTCWVTRQSRRRLCFTTTTAHGRSWAISCPRSTKRSCSYAVNT